MALPEDLVGPVLLGLVLLPLLGVHLLLHLPLVGLLHPGLLLHGEEAEELPGLLLLMVGRQKRKTLDRVPKSSPPRRRLPVSLPRRRRPGELPRNRPKRSVSRLRRQRKKPPPLPTRLCPNRARRAGLVRGRNARVAQPR